MKFNVFIFFSLFSFFSLNATETYWDGERSLNICDCRIQSKRFIPDDDLKSIVFSMNDGILDIYRSIDSFIEIEAKGSKKKLNNITFSKDDKSYYLEERNDSKNYSSKQTLIILYLPKSTCTWNFSFQGTGRGQIIVYKIFANTIKAEISDYAKFKLLNFESSSLKFVGNNQAELCAVGSISNLIDLKSSDNSYIYVKQQQKKLFQTLKINSQNFGQVSCSGNHAICKDKYEVTAQDNAKIGVEGLHVLASKAKIKTSGYSKVSSCCSFNSFDAFLNNFSELMIQEFEYTSAKNFNADLKSKNLHSTAIVQQYGNFNLSDWVNKIIVDVQNSGQFTANMTRPMEATIITAQNNAKVKFLMPVARAKVTAKNNSEIFFVKVTGILKDILSDNAKIEADKLPLKDFVF